MAAARVLYCTIAVVVLVPIAVAHGETFLQRLTMNGAFEIPAERVTDTATEQSLSAFSRGAQGLHTAAPGDLSEQDVISSVAGEVSILDGVAHASR